MAQPLVRSGETELYGDGIAERYGLEGATDCRGIDYVEFKVPRGAADKIRTFYDCVFDAPTAIVTDASGGGGGGMIAIVGIPPGAPGGGPPPPRAPWSASDLSTRWVGPTKVSCSVSVMTKFRPTMATTYRCM